MDKKFFSIEHLIKTELPPMPASVSRVSELLTDMRVSQQAIADAISLDPILSSRILRLANSATYGLHGTVTNLLSAVSTVGNAAISDILLMSGISDSFGRKVLRSRVGRTIWQHLVATAMTASEICHVSGMRGADEAFSCGLLHDIGKLILLRADALLYTDLTASPPIEGGIRALEKSVYGFDHAELGAEAAIAWKLPGAVCHMIRFHHEPTKVQAGVAMAHIINLADTLVTLKTDGKPMFQLMASESAQAFHLTESQYDDVWETVTQRLSEIVETFD